MAEFTPSNLYIASVGSAKMSIAHVSEDILSGTNYWASGIPDIISVMPTMYGGTTLTASSSNLIVSWTASNGTIHLSQDASLSNTGFILWIISGMGQDVWNRP